MSWLSLYNHFRDRESEMKGRKLTLNVEMLSFLTHADIFYSEPKL